MKQIYVRVIANNKFGYSIINCNDYKDYPDYGVSIIKYKETYLIIDTQTGLHTNKRFKKLKDAKSFMDHIKDSNFLNWYNAVERSRMTERYKSMIIRVR